MAERFVVGFKVDIDAIYALVGGDQLEAEIIEAAGGSGEVDELLKEWAPKDPLTAEQAVRAICKGKLDPGRAYEYRRALELIAAGVGERFDDEIDVITSYYLPNDSHGRWNPVLEALGLKELAERWGTNNQFPWKEGEILADWPIATMLEPATVKAIAAELDALDSQSIDKLPVKLLAEKGEEEEAPYVQEELKIGLETLAGWLARAEKEELGLLMIMDGSQ